MSAYIHGISGISAALFILAGPAALYAESPLKASGRPQAQSTTVYDHRTTGNRSNQPADQKAARDDKSPRLQSRRLRLKSSERVAVRGNTATVYRQVGSQSVVSGSYSCSCPTSGGTGFGGSLRRCSIVQKSNEIFCQGFCSCDFVTISNPQVMKMK